MRDVSEKSDAGVNNGVGDGNSGDYTAVDGGAWAGVDFGEVVAVGDGSGTDVDQCGRAMFSGEGTGTRDGDVVGAVFCGRRIARVSRG